MKYHRAFSQQQTQKEQLSTIPQDFASRTLIASPSGGFKSSNCHIGGKRFLYETNGKPANIEIVSPTQLLAFAFRARF
jgi:hypothetical protein